MRPLNGYICDVKVVLPDWRANRVRVPPRNIGPIYPLNSKNKIDVDSCASSAARKVLLHDVFGFHDKVLGRQVLFLFGK